MVHVLLLETAGQGCQWMCRQVGMALLHMHKVFPALKGKQMIMISLGHITIVVLALRVGNYIRGVHMSLRLSSVFLAAVHLVAIG